MCGDDPSSAFPQAECVTDIPSTFSGTIRHVLGMPVAEVANACGAGRKKAADSVNFSVGIDDQSIFPEIDVDKVKRTQGMDVTIVTTAKNDDDAYELLKEFGMPFDGNRK